MKTSNDERGAAVVVGAGPGLGASVAARFAREGYRVALMARRRETLSAAAQRIAELGGESLSLEVDATDEASVESAFRKAREAHGAPSVLVYNAGAFKMSGLMETTPKDFDDCFRANCTGGFLAAREVVPGMLESGEGTLLFTGATASIRGGAKFACLAVGKFGLRALSQSLARELGPQGIHVAHVVVDGQIDSPRIRQMLPGRAIETFLDPDAIAEAYWHLHRQPPTTWTLELDVRPSVEKF
jgi:NAD(P)-dependent dehydrogenase (short-subunit alcohol dehydrogenase family)